MYSRIMTVQLIQFRPSSQYYEVSKHYIKRLNDTEM
jgi:hypothetical protein